MRTTHTQRDNNEGREKAKTDADGRSKERAGCAHVDGVFCDSRTTPSLPPLPEGRKFPRWFRLHLYERETMGARRDRSFLAAVMPSSPSFLLRTRALDTTLAKSMLRSNKAGPHERCGSWLGGARCQPVITAKTAANSYVVVSVRDAASSLIYSQCQLACVR